MKKVLALVLCICLCIPTFSGCSKKDDSDKGAIINMYIGSEIRDFDPATAYKNSDAVKVLGLLYEGLMKIESNGKLVKGIAEKYTIDKEENKITFDIKTTCWSDGEPVTSGDFMFAFKRILEPSFSSTAAVLLYSIKNAREVKAGNVSIDSLGITAPDSTLLQIELEEGADFDEFLENLASPALVPLRQDKVSKPLTDEKTGKVQFDEYDMQITDTSWCERATMHVANGPFCLKTVSDDGVNNEYVLERNRYYLTDGTVSDEQKNVTPYRIVIHYDYFKSDYDAGLKTLSEQYNNGTLFYNSAFDAETYASIKDDLTVTDMFSTASYTFNGDNPLFAIAEVRQALSLALDRNEIANLTSGMHVAATGLVPSAVYNTKYGTSFRAVHGDAMSASADLDGAKALIKGVTLPKDEEGNTIKSFTLYYRNFVEYKLDEKIANYAKEQWEKLGFKVTLKGLARTAYDECFEGKTYDVISFDYQTNSTSAISTLAPFALEYSGEGKDTVLNDFTSKSAFSGYNSEAYNKLIDEAYAMKPYSEERANKLFEAEQLLMKDSPIIPLFYYRDAYTASSSLKKISSSIYGFRYFTKTSLKNYKDYLPVTEADNAAAAQ